MSSSNKTTRLQLSQFQPNDRPKWLDDYNADMGRIEAGFTEQEAGMTALANAVSGIRTGIDPITLDVSASSGVKHYFGCTVSGIISGTAEVYLTNCKGSLSLFGDAAKITRVNSPNLDIGGVTQINRINVSTIGPVLEKPANPEHYPITAGYPFSCGGAYYELSKKFDADRIIPINVWNGHAEYDLGTRNFMLFAMLYLGNWEFLNDGNSFFLSDIPGNAQFGRQGDNGLMTRVVKDVNSHTVTSDFHQQMGGNLKIKLSGWAFGFIVLM